MVLSSLLYTSELAPGIGPEVVPAITRVARRNNLRDGITGLLVFDGARFVQWVEGPPPAMEALLGRLNADDRHTALDILQCGPHEGAPLFPDWQLAFHLAEPATRDLQSFMGLDGAMARARLQSMLPHLDMEVR